MYDQLTSINIVLTNLQRNSHQRGAKTNYLHYDKLDG